MKAVIIDDEPLVREDLRYLLSQHPDIEIIAQAGTVLQAEKIFSERQPDVVFLDVQLIRGSRFDLLPLIHPATHIIFFTAHDGYAVRAFEANALDYLLKPVTVDRLADSLQRLRRRHQGLDTAPQPHKPFRREDRIFVKTDTGHRFVPVQVVLAVTSIGGNYTALHRDCGSRLVVRRTMKEWEDLLPADLFMRIHRGTVVNLSRIDRIRKEKDGPYLAYLSGAAAPFEVSRRTAAHLKRLINEMS